METMKSITVWLKRLTATIMPSTDDKVWWAWANAKPRNRADLVSLINEPGVRDSIKARALFLLFVPTNRWVRFRWYEHADSPVIGKFSRGELDLAGLSESLRQYVAELIMQFVDALRPLHDPNPENKCVSGPGMAVYWSVPGKYHDALSFYNECIPSLLDKLPEEMANQLFERFSLVDVSSFWNMDDASGLNPFVELLYDTSIDESWKRKADARVRQLILAEHLGIAQPRQEWEGALSNYSDMLRTMLYGEKLRYSTDFYASQVEYLMSDELAGAKRTIVGYLVPRLFGKLNGDAYRELRHRISRFVLFTSDDLFQVDCSDTYVAAQQMLIEFGDEDTELKHRLNDLLGQYKVRQLQDEKNRQEQENDDRSAAEAERKLIDAMK